MVGTKQSDSRRMVTLARSCLRAGVLGHVWPPSGGSPRGRARTPARYVAGADRLGVSRELTAAAKWLPGADSGVSSSPLRSSSAGLFEVPATYGCRDRVCLAPNLRRGPCSVTLGGAPRPLGSDAVPARGGRWVLWALVKGADRSHPACSWRATHAGPLIVPGACAPASPAGWWHRDPPPLAPGPGSGQVPDLRMFLLLLAACSTDALQGPATE